MEILPPLRYSAIDMSTFEALKLGYLRSTSKEEPGVLALLAFGSISGSVGATMVYPLNLVRTRLQRRLVWAPRALFWNRGCCQEDACARWVARVLPRVVPTLAKVRLFFFL